MAAPEEERGMKCPYCKSVTEEPEPDCPNCGASDWGRPASYPVPVLSVDQIFPVNRLWAQGYL